MYNKTMAVVSYITLIGWIIAYVSYSGSADKNPTNRYHLQQAFGLMLLSFGLSIAINILAYAVPTIASVLSIGYLLILILWVIGIINAANESEKPLPIVGQWFEGKFNFIS